MRGRTKRRRAYRRGRLSEHLATWLLRLKGYRIEAVNWRCRQGEIDIIARRGGILVFVEVKRRTVMADAAAALSPLQRRRIANAAAVYLSRREGGHEFATGGVRFDVILVARGCRVQHIKDAWRAD